MVLTKTSATLDELIEQESEIRSEIKLRTAALKQIRVTRKAFEKLTSSLPEKKPARKKARRKKESARDSAAA